MKSAGDLLDVIQVHHNQLSGNKSSVSAKDPVWR